MRWDIFISFRTDELGFQPETVGQPSCYHSSQLRYETLSQRMEAILHIKCVSKPWLIGYGRVKHYLGGNFNHFLFLPLLGEDKHFGKYECKIRFNGMGKKCSLRHYSVSMLYRDYLGVSENGGTPKWMVKIMENPIKMDDLGGTLTFGNTHL